MTTWLVIAAVAIGTYVLRASMFVVLGGRTLPAWTERPMALIGPAAVAALVTSIVATGGGRATGTPDRKPRAWKFHVGYWKFKPAQKNRIQQSTGPGTVNRKSVHRHW